jgi:transposase
VRTPEGESIPPNTLAELYRDMERRGLVLEQIRQIEKAHLEHLNQAPNARPNVMVRLLAHVIGVWDRDGGHAGVGGIVTQLARPTSRGALRRPHGFAPRKWRQTPGERACPIRQRSVRRGMIELAWRFLMKSSPCWKMLIGGKLPASGRTAQPITIETPFKRPLQGHQGIAVIGVRDHVRSPL